jgi:hypothetical protein
MSIRSSSEPEMRFWYIIPVDEAQSALFHPGGHLRTIAGNHPEINFSIYEFGLGVRCFPMQFSQSFFFLQRFKHERCFLGGREDSSPGHFVS